MDQHLKYPRPPGGAPSGLWEDVLEIPLALEATVRERAGIDTAVELVSRRAPERLVVSGNGAAYYVAQVLWLASMMTARPCVEVVAVPSGLLAKGRFAWRPGDMFVAVSSSGEFRDLVEAIGAGAPQPYIAVTSSPTSSVGRNAAVVAGFKVLGQRAITHSQVFCGGVATVLSIWAGLSDDHGLSDLVEELPTLARAAVSDASQWSADVLGTLTDLPRSAVTCATGAGWAAAMEAALLLKEVARVPTEGCEIREAATSGMYALGPGDLAFTLPSSSRDLLLAEAEEIFTRTGATVLRAPALRTALDERVMGVATFPAAAALAITLARLGSCDPDEPSWATTYYQTAR